MATTVNGPILGIDGQLTDDQLDPRAAAKHSQNVVYGDGVIETAKGFSALDSTSSLSGKPILALFKYVELDRTEHQMAVTRTKIYTHDTVNSQWDDLTQSGTALVGNVDTRVSWVALAHDDSAIYLNDDAAKARAYYHLVVCDGGDSDIQRWAGKYETSFLDLTGAGGYHDGTKHRALQVGAFQNRLLLLSDRSYSTSSQSWTRNGQRLRWPTRAKLQTWTGDYSGFSDLIDTGGINVWSAPLGQAYYVYQTNSIWDIRYVGGKTVFDPKPVVNDLGLLASGLLLVVGNVAYFVGDDFNVYAYYGGSLKKAVGDAVHKYLIDDLASQYTTRACMVLGAKKRRLWIYIVPSGQTYITKGYGMDLTTGAWMVRDFSSRYDGTTAGITAAALFGAGSYESGDSFAQELLKISAYDISDDGDATERFGDLLLASQRTLSVDATEASWCTGGTQFYCACADVTYKADITINDIIRVADGSKFTNTRSGTHFYSVCAVGDHTVWLRLRDPSLAVSDADSKPADVSWTAWNPSGTTFAQVISTILTDEQIVLGDSSGFVYQCSTTSTLEQLTYLSAQHLTPVVDWNEPDKLKRWQGMTVIARQASTGNGRLVVGYRTSHFDTSDTGWTNLTSVELTAQYKSYSFPINIQSERIQWRFKNTAAGSDWQIQSYRHTDPVYLVDR